MRRQIRAGGQLRPGDRLGDGQYLLLERIGRGGFANVWRARDDERRCEVAIKVIHNEVGADPVRLERFFRGARIMAELDHPAIVKVLSQRGQDEHFYYFVMELAEGGNLRELVLRDGIDHGEACSVVLQIADALGLAHKRGLVHRDVKPANVLLGRDRRPLLSDFDLVSAADTTGGTRTGAMGTFVYAAPEILSKPQDADARADVYALAVTMIFLLGRAEPVLIVRDPNSVVRSLGCSGSMQELLLKSLDWDRDRRPADATAFRDALIRALLVSSSVVAPSIRGTEKTDPRSAVRREDRSASVHRDLPRGTHGTPTAPRSRRLYEIAVELSLPAEAAVKTAQRLGLPIKNKFSAVPNEHIPLLVAALKSVRGLYIVEVEVAPGVRRLKRMLGDDDPVLPLTEDNLARVSEDSGIYVILARGRRVLATQRASNLRSHLQRYFDTRRTTDATDFAVFPDDPPGDPD